MVDLRFVAKRLFRSMVVSINPRWVKPRDICLCITHKCNSRCMTCNVWRTNKPEPTLESLKRWIKQAADYGVSGVSLSGGEPFLREDLREIVDFAHDHGLYCGIGTNGLLVGAGKVPIPNVDSATVSIDGGYRETHDRIRGVKGSWVKAWKAVTRFLNSGVDPAINFVLQTMNYTELPKLCEKALENGVKQVNVLPVSLGGFSQASVNEWDKLRTFDADLLEESLNKAYETGVLMNSREFLDLVLAKIRGENVGFSCILQSIRFLIGSDGNVYPCSVFSEPVGSLYNKSFKQIMESTETQEIRDLCLTGKCPYWESCLSQELDSCLRERFSNYSKFILKKLKMRVTGER